MKKILLLSITSLAMLMADFTLIGEQLVFPQSVGENGSTPIETPLPQNNKYLEPVEIPAYNANDATHVLITPTNGKWNESVINNLSYKHFYIEAGDYTGSGIIYLRSDGSAGNRRTLSLYNPLNPTDETHPASLQDNEQANVRFYFNSASYWDIDRVSNLDDADSAYMMWFQNNSLYNTINRYHGKGMYKGIYIAEACNYNTVQNSYIHDATHSGRVNDALGVGLRHEGGASRVTRGTKIINNDIKNLGDGIQLIEKDTGDISYPETVIDSNRVWIDNTIYTDGNGQYTTSGEYAVAENGIDLKAGSNEANNPVIITNNKCWGYRHTDTTLMNSISGVPVNISFPDTRNVQYENNVVFDSEWGMHLLHLAGSASRINNNILYSIGHVTPYPKDVIGLSTPDSSYGGADSSDVPVTNNSFVNMRVHPVNGGTALWVSTNTYGINISSNLFIDTVNITGNIGGQTRADNWYYNHVGATLGGTNENDMTSTNPPMGDYTFAYEQFTSQSKTKTLVGVISTTDSSHYQKAGSSIGN